jgi:Lamin Tail Domain
LRRILFIAAAFAACSFGLSPIGSVPGSDTGSDGDGGASDSGITTDGGFDTGGDTDDGGSADGGSADGGSADGGSADGGSADGGVEEPIERAPSAGDLVISEIMAAPAAVPDDKGEYFELYNNSTDIIQLDGLVFEDDGTDEVSIATSAGITVQPGAYAVICRIADYTQNGGVVCDWGWNEDNQYALQFSPDSDELRVKLNTTTIDEVLYTSAWGMPSGAALGVRAASMSAAGNDNSSVWCQQASELDKGDHGTPGAANDAC